MQKLFTLFTAILFAGSMWAVEYSELFTIQSSSVVTSNTYAAYTTTVSNRGWVITFGGYSKAVGTNSNNRSSCNLGNYTKYAVSPVSTSGVAAAFVSTTSISNVSKISYTISGGSNQTNTKVYLIYSSDNTTFSQMSLTSGTQGATISSGTAFEFVQCSGYFGLLFEATNQSGNWRIDDVNITFYEGTSTDPAIAATNIDFGTVYVPKGNNFSYQYELAVFGTSLSEAISAVSSDNDKVAVSGTLTKDGGKLTVDITASHGAFAETIKLTSGEIEKVVNVTGTVQEKYAEPLSVANAISAYAAGTLIVNDSLQVRGLVKSATPIYNVNATIVITDIADPTKEFTLYSIKSLNKANFASFDDNKVIDVNNVKFTVGDTLTAYGKVSTFGEPAAPQIASGGYLIEVARDKASIVPEVIATPKSISLDSHEAVTDKTIALSYENWEAELTSVSATLYSDEECTQNITLGGWVSGFAFNEDKSELTFNISENTVTEARKAYILIAAQNASEEAQVVVPVSQVAAPTLDTYKPVTLANIKSTDVVIVTMKSDSKLYALSSATSSGNYVAAVDVTSSKSGDNLSVYSNAEVFWNVADSAAKGYMLYPDGETARWLTGPTGSNAYTKINTGGAKFWTINKDYLYNTSASKHLGVYSAQDWRCYAPSGDNIHTNIAGQTLGFYVKDNGEATSLSNTASDTKAVKTIVNGQLIIKKAGVKYNVLGQTIR